MKINKKIKHDQIAHRRYNFLKQSKLRKLSTLSDMVLSLQNVAMCSKEYIKLVENDNVECPFIDFQMSHFDKALQSIGFDLDGIVNEEFKEIG